MGIGGHHNKHSNTLGYSAISPDSLRIAKLIGSGRTGSVFKGTIEVEGVDREVAVKMYDEGHSATNEVAAHAKIRHESIVAPLGAPLPNGSLVFELIDGLSLEEITGTEKAKVNRLRPAIDQLIDAVEAIHTAGFVHGDIDPSNVLISNDGNAHVIDLHCAHPANGEPLQEGSPHCGPHTKATPLCDIRALASVFADVLSQDMVTSTILIELVALFDATDTGSLDDVRGAFPAIEFESSQPAKRTGNTIRFISDSPAPPAPTAASMMLSKQTALIGLAIAAVLAAATVIGPGALGGADEVAADLPTTTTVVIEQDVATAGTDVLALAESMTPQDAFTAAKMAAHETITQHGGKWDDEAGTLTIDGNTFKVGTSGDVAAIGDWNCDGETTLGVYRPDSGSWFEFDDWTASATSSIPVTVNDDGFVQQMRVIHEACYDVTAAN